MSASEQASVFLAAESTSQRVNFRLRTNWCCSCSSLWCMPAWLSPRVRLGVMVSVIAVSVCAHLLTPARSESDHQPNALDPPVASTAPAAATPSSTHSSKPIALPQAVINSLGLRSSGPSSESSSGTASSGSSKSAAADPDAWSRLAVPDTYGELVLAERGVALTWPGCLDCTAPHAPQIPFGPFFTRAGGSGSTGGAGSAGGAGNAGGAGFLPDATSPDGLTEFGNPSLEALGRGNGEGPRRPGDLPRDLPGDNGRGHSPTGDDDPIHPIGPIGPKVPPSVPVPEPSTISLLAAATFALTAWGRRARMNRD